MSLPEEAQTPAHAPTPLEQIASRVEEELERLRDLRPALSDRVDRAASILVSHLSSRKSRILLVRVGADRKPRVLVASRSPGSVGAVYVVDPHSWSCSCPDFYRRDGGACKHGIAVYILWRAGRHPRGCPACHGGTVYLTVEEGGQERTEPVPCRRCSSRSQVEGSR